MLTAPWRHLADLGASKVKMRWAMRKCWCSRWAGAWPHPKAPGVSGFLSPELAGSWAGAGEQV